MPNTQGPPADRIYSRDTLENLISIYRHETDQVEIGEIANEIKRRLAGLRYLTTSVGIEPRTRTRILDELAGTNHFGARSYAYPEQR